MARMLSWDAFTYLYLLLCGLVFVAALCARRNGRHPARHDADVRPLSTRFDRIDNRNSFLPRPDANRMLEAVQLGRLTPGRPRSSRAKVAYGLFGLCDFAHRSLLESGNAGDSCNLRP